MVGVTLVSAGVILFVMLPVLRGDWATLVSPDGEISDVESRKRAALRGLRDAEYDFRSGKLDEADYQALKSDLSREALEAMEEESAVGRAGDEGTPTAGAADPLERAAAGLHGDELEAQIARVRKGMAQGRTCSACGHLNVKKSRFCTGCGGRVGAVVATPAAGKPASS